MNNNNIPKIANVNDYLKKLKKFSSKNNFKILHLNVNSLRNKIDQLLIILNLRIFDIVCLNETRLDYFLHPLSVLKSPYYNILRSDRDENNGGGVLVYVRNEYIISKSTISPVIEAIYFEISFKKQKFNFISCYNPPNIILVDFISDLEDFLFHFNLDEPLFLIGDFNIDMFTPNQQFTDFLKSYDLKNFVKDPTRVFTKSFVKKNNIVQTSSSQIDLVLHNKNLILSNEVIDCPFSDHKFVLTSLNIKSTKCEPKFVSLRNFSLSNLSLIKESLSTLDLSVLYNFNLNADDKWLQFKEMILSKVNPISPVKKILISLKNNTYPWVDQELSLLIRERDKAYNISKKSLLSHDHNLFIKLKKRVSQVTNLKMIEFFKDKQMKDFKNTKKFFQFYKSSFTLKSDKSNGILPNYITDGKNSASDSLGISKLFNSHFTNIKSNSSATHDASNNFITSSFDQFFKNNQLPNLTNKNFNFQKIDVSIISKLIMKLDSSNGPGISDINVRIFKSCVTEFAPVVTNIINDCITSGTVPAEWKCAIVTALYKGKGSIEDINNYRGISVLPLVSKIFEKVIASQILYYLKANKILFNGQ